MGKVKEFLWTEPDQELDQEPDEEYDHNLSTIHQLKVIRKRLADLVESKRPYKRPIKAWDEIINYIGVLLKQERHEECIHGTVGCITRHKNYDTCTDDPTYVHGS